MHVRALRVERRRWPATLVERRKAVRASNDMALARPCGARRQRCCALRRSISPRLFIFQARRLATLMRFGAMSGLRVGYFWREWRKRYLLICTNEASLKRAAV